MKITAKSIAAALVPMFESEKDHAHVSDAALHLARKSGIPPYQLIKAVKVELQRAGNTVSAVLETPTGDAGSEAKSISSALEAKLKKNIQLQQKSSNILGGAILTVGDDRLDKSLTGALSRAHRFLRTSHTSV